MSDYDLFNCFADWVEYGLLNGGKGGNFVKLLDCLRIDCWERCSSSSIIILFFMLCCRFSSAIGVSSFEMVLLTEISDI